MQNFDHSRGLRALAWQLKFQVFHFLNEFDDCLRLFNGVNSIGGVGRVCDVGGDEAVGYDWARENDFLNDLFQVGREDSESTERTLLLEYCVFDNEHPTAPELAAARTKIVAVLRKMKSGKRKLIDVHTGSNRRDSVITVPVEKRDRAGGGISSTSKSKDGGGKSSSNSKKDRRAGDGTKSPDFQQGRSAPKKRKQNPLAPRRAISSEDESDDCSDDDHDDVSGIANFINLESLKYDIVLNRFCVQRGH